VDLASRLPRVDAVPGVRPGTLFRLPTAQALVEKLYEPGPDRDGVRERLEEGGYAGGVLRDQGFGDPGDAPLAQS